MIDDVTFWSKLDSVYMVSLLDYAPTRRKGAVSIAFVFPSVRPSVCPSVVAYILNNSRTWMPIVSKFGMTVPHLRCDLHTSFKVNRSKIKVTRPIYAHTHRAPYLPNGNSYELQTWQTDGWRRPASDTGAMTSAVKGQGRKVTWSVWAVLAYCCICVIRGRRGYTVSGEPGGHTSCFIMICSGYLVVSQKHTH